MSALRCIHSATNEYGITRHWWADDKGNITVEAVQDLEPLIEHNKAAQAARGKKITSELYNPIGVIPPIFISKWLHEEGWFVYDAERDPDVDKKLRAKLNDPDFKYLLRTSELAI